MRKGFTAFLLALSCLGVSAAVLADHTTKAAGNLYTWDVAGDEVLTIYSVAPGTRCNNTIQVTVSEAGIQSALGRNDDHHGHGERSILLQGCASGPATLNAGQTFQCLVRPGSQLTVSIPCEDDQDSDDNVVTTSGDRNDDGEEHHHHHHYSHVRGTWQQIRI